MTLLDRIDAFLAEHDAEPVTLTYPEAVALRRDLDRLREHDEAAAERLDSLLGDIDDGLI